MSSTARQAPISLARENRWASSLGQDRARGILSFSKITEVLSCD